MAGWFNRQRAIILAIQRQPGANVIATVDRVKAMLPQLQASIPKDIKVSILSDRTQTIRASVSDVRFTLMLTVALVVMVIFVFLRNFWATVIPAITVPLSLIGTFAVLYELGYSLDNLSLMALTIAVGFVVDDAVVVIENIVRHLEEGLSPMQAAIKGSGEIGFTIVSITLSLIAVFIPLFLMGGYVGHAVPRIRGHRQRGAGVVVIDLPDADADDVLAPAEAGDRGARPDLSAVRARIRPAGRGLRPWA